MRFQTESNHQKTATDKEDSGSSVVHEGEQANRRESEVCGAPPRATGGRGPLNPKWIGAGAAGTGLLICVIAHCFGGGSGPVSPSQP